MTLVLITRPSPEAEATARDVVALGFRAVAAPVLHMEMTGAVWPEPQGFDGLIFTSARAVAALPAGWIAHDMRVFAVGEHTAAAARAAGFTRVISADGDAAALSGLIAERIDGGARFFHPCGAESAAELTGNFTVQRLVTYRMLPMDRMPEAAARPLREGTVDIALFYSPGSGRVFAELAEKAGLAGAFGRTRALCLSGPVVKSVARLGWAETLCAARPDHAAMLDLLRDRGRSL